MSLETLQALWDIRAQLPADPVLMDALADIRQKHLPGAAIARRLAIYLTSSQSRYSGSRSALVESIREIQSVRYRNKKILLVSLSHESEDVHNHIADHLQRVVQPVDLFLHYPYTQNRLAKVMVEESYAAKHPYSLDTPEQFERFGDEIRFHYCDLRLDWFDSDSDKLQQRLKLLGSYSEYLLQQEDPHAENTFGQQLRRNKIELRDFLELDQALIRLEGKIRKSYEATDKDLREMILLAYERSTKECRVRLDALREEMLKQAIIPVFLFIEFIGELNQLYQHLNACYVLLRMFRHFHQVKDRHSADAVNCVVVLPKPIVGLLQKMLPSLKGSRDTIEDWFAGLDRNTRVF